MATRRDDGPGRMWERPQKYDAMVDWAAREKTEVPFYRRHLGSVRRVLDVACGPGHQALWLTEHGYIVEGCDLSPEMVGYAQKAALAADREVEFFEADMTALPADRGPYDAVICVGNGLAALPTEDQLRGFTRSAADLLNPGGLMLCQMANLERLAGKGPQYLPARSGMIDGTEIVFLKVMEYPVDGRGRVDIVMLTRGEGNAWNTEVSKGTLSPWSRQQFEAALAHAGLEPIGVYGGHDDSPFDPATSRDLIVVARKPA